MPANPTKPKLIFGTPGKNLHTLSELKEVLA